jgi:dinuclear metal center YbgI/SA1388 family protein
MTCVNEIFKFLTDFAPLELAESFDNPGLLAGDPKSEVTKALLSLDITSAAAKEASERGAQLVISHHPVIFKPLRSVLCTGVSAPVWNLARFSLSAICMHTNLDTANGGVNDTLARAVGLEQVKNLCNTKIKHYKKITVFVPDEFAQKVRLAMAEAGAGKLGEYDGCSYETDGHGYFRPLAGAKPFIGEQNKPECVNEKRIEAICAPDKVKAVVSAMLDAHPYEVPAYDIFDDEAVCDKYGIGRVGILPESVSADIFAKDVKKALSTSCVKVVDCGKKVHKVALCSGATDEELIMRAAEIGADTFLTGEMKHNLYYTAIEAGINIIEAGHFATETVVLPILKEKLTAAFPQVCFEIADCNREPYHTV